MRHVEKRIAIVIGVGMVLMLALLVGSLMIVQGML